MAKAKGKRPLDIFSEFLAERGLRMTPQRRLILEAFLEHGGHMAPEELYDAVRKADSSIGQATVYRTVKLLAESGLAKAVRFDDGVTRYEPEHGREHHDHLICERCRRTEEILDERIEELQEELARKKGYILTGHKMHLFGICSKCRKQDEKE